MDVFKVTVVFKDWKSIEIDTVAPKDPRTSFANDWKDYKKEGAVAIGDYIFDIDSILYIKVKGEKKGEERSRKKLQDTGKKKL